MRDFDNQHELNDFTLFALKGLLTRLYGERCESFQRNCPTCDAWGFYDDLKETVTALTEVKNAMEQRK